MYRIVLIKVNTKNYVNRDLNGEIDIKKHFCSIDLAIFVQMNVKDVIFKL